MSKEDWAENFRKTLQQKSGLGVSSKPEIAFSFEPLNDLAKDCAQNFSSHPLSPLPNVLISPAHYFKPYQAALYHQQSGCIYFKDNFVNEATPDNLVRTMLECLAHAWVHQNIFPMSQDYIPETDPKYCGAYESVSRLIGLTKKPGP